MKRGDPLYLAQVLTPRRAPAVARVCVGFYFGPSKHPDHSRIKVAHARWPIHAANRWITLDPQAAARLLRIRIAEAIHWHEYAISHLHLALDDHQQSITIIWPKEPTAAEISLGIEH